MGVAFVALKRGRGQGGCEGASPQRAVTEQPTQPPAPFQCNPKGCKPLGRLSALLAEVRTHEGHCRIARALKYGPKACSKGRPHLISGSLRQVKLDSGQNRVMIPPVSPQT